jgi:hypothetical protein
VSSAGAAGPSPHSCDVPECRRMSKAEVGLSCGVYHAACFNSTAVGSQIVVECQFPFSSGPGTRRQFLETNMDELAQLQGWAQSRARQPWIRRPCHEGDGRSDRIFPLSPRNPGAAGPATPKIFGPTALANRQRWCWPLRVCAPSAWLVQTGTTRPLGQQMARHIQCFGRRRGCLHSGRFAPSLGPQD